MAMKRKRKEITPPAPGQWLTTYSDMITLCLTFFVLLYSFSTLDAIKWKTVVTSVQGALGPMNAGNKPMEGETFTSGAISEGEKTEEEIQNFKKYQQETEKLNDIQAQLSSYLNKQGLADYITIIMEERGLLMRFEDSTLFVKGKADLIEQSVGVLNKIADTLVKIDNPIRIEGHTDDLAINTPRFPSNWELSTARAINVLRILIDRGISPKRLSAVGYGEYHPIVPNDGEDNRKKNRRVDIVIIRGDMRLNEPK